MSTLGYHLNLVSCRLQAVSYIVFNPLSPNGDQHQFSLNNIICMRCQENREEKCYVKFTMVSKSLDDNKRAEIKQ